MELKQNTRTCMILNYQEFIKHSNTQLFEIYVH